MTQERFWTILIVLIAVAVLVVALYPPRVRAQECQTIDATMALIEDNGGTFLDLIDVNGAGFDQLVIADLGGAIVVGAFNGGCAVGGPVALGPSVVRTGV